MSPNDFRDETDGRAVDWMIWKVVVPAVLLFLFWPVYRWVLQVEHPFERAFCHGDLLIFSALLLVEASLEGEHGRRQTRRLRIAGQACKGFAVALLFLVGFIRYDVIVREPLLAGGPGEVADVLGKFFGYSVFNLSVAVVAIVYSGVAYWAGVRRLYEDRLSAIGGSAE